MSRTRPVKQQQQKVPAAVPPRPPPVEQEDVEVAPRRVRAPKRRKNTINADEYGDTTTASSGAVVEQQEQVARSTGCSNDGLSSKTSFYYHDADDLWKQRFLELKEFKAKHGHVNVPITKDSGHLSKWVSTQRTSFKSGSLSQDRINQLLSVGFSFDILAVSWEHQFDELKEFKAQHGHVNVPWSCQAMNKWVTAQRRLFRQGKLPDDRRNKLEGIGFPFDVEQVEHERLAQKWEQKFKELQAFKAKHGHVNVPHRCTSLKGWTAYQLSQFRKKKLTGDRIRKLESAGMLLLHYRNTTEDDNDGKGNDVVVSSHERSSDSSRLLLESSNDVQDDDEEDKPLGKRLRVCAAHREQQSSFQLNLGTTAKEEDGEETASSKKASGDHTHLEQRCADGSPPLRSLIQAAFALIRKHED